MIEYDVYCDESFPDSLSASSPKTPYFFIGGLSCPTEKRAEIKERLKIIKQKHKMNIELKWRKVSPQKDAFYKDLIDLFFEYDFSFRCIIVDSRQINMAYHKNDKELCFYKFYYQMLEHWLSNNNNSGYHIFCDFKMNKNKTQISELSNILKNHHLIINMQQIESKQSVLLQFSDFLLGFITAKTTKLPEEKSYKFELIEYFERKLGKILSETFKSEKKYNVFKINLGQ